MKYHFDLTILKVDIIYCIISILLLYVARFQVLTVGNMKISVFWDVAPFGLAETDRRFRGACCVRYKFIALMKEPVNTSETSVSFYHTT
jgi:hypothetical protein